MSRATTRDEAGQGPPRRNLAPGLALLAARRRHVSYRRAEADAGRLAERLRRALPAADLAAATFRAIPRGGLIVLGLLAYHLGLRRDQLHGEADEAADGGPLVLVDDCALSGLRLHQEIARLPAGRRVVAAQLYSPRELRQAVVAAEPRVEACVAAHDLADLSAELYPGAEERAAWRRRWRERLGDDGRYWLGMPEPVSFAWSEPDRPLWNAASGAVEDGWRFAPPHRCLGNRLRLARGLPAEVLAAAEAAPGSPSHLAEDVVWGEFEGVVWFCRTAGEGDDGEVFSLDGSATLVVKALLTAGEAAAAVALAAVYEVDAETARRDVAALRGELAAAGLLAAVGAAAEGEA